jgi:hypothetical protein
VGHLYIVRDDITTTPTTWGLGFIWCYLNLLLQICKRVSARLAWFQNHKFLPIFRTLCWISRSSCACLFFRFVSRLKVVLDTARTIPIGDNISVTKAHRLVIVVVMQHNADSPRNQVIHLSSKGWDKPPLIRVPPQDHIYSWANSLLVIKTTCGSLLIIKKINFPIGHWIKILFLIGCPSVKVEEQKSLLPLTKVLCNLQIWTTWIPTLYFSTTIICFVITKNVYYCC